MLTERDATLPAARVRLIQRLRISVQPVISPRVESELSFSSQLAEVTRLASKVMFQNKTQSLDGRLVNP